MALSVGKFSCHLINVEGFRLLWAEPSSEHVVLGYIKKLAYMQVTIYRLSRYYLGIYIIM